MAKKKKSRKPRALKNPTYPMVEVEGGRIWMRGKANSHWVKVPKGRARYLADRLNRAADYVEQS